MKEKDLRESTVIRTPDLYHLEIQMGYPGDKANDHRDYPVLVFTPNTKREPRKIFHIPLDEQQADDLAHWLTEWERYGFEKSSRPGLPQAPDKNAAE